MTMARFTIYVMLLGVKGVNSCRHSCAMRCNPSAGARAQAPAPGREEDVAGITS